MWVSAERRSSTAGLLRCAMLLLQFLFPSVTCFLLVYFHFLLIFILTELAGEPLPIFFIYIKMEYVQACDTQELNLKEKENIH